MADINRDDNRTKISMSRIGSRSLLAPGGSITRKDIETLDRINQDLMEENRNEIILDLKSVSFIDSSFLEYILKMHDDLKVRGGYLKFIGVNAICRDIFTATRLINTFLIFEDIHEAIKN